MLFPPQIFHCWSNARKKKIFSILLTSKDFSSLVGMFHKIHLLHLEWRLSRCKRYTDKWQYSFCAKICYHIGKVAESTVMQIRELLISYFIVKKNLDVSSFLAWWVPVIKLYFLLELLSLSIQWCRRYFLGKKRSLSLLWLIYKVLAPA